MEYQLNSSPGYQKWTKCTIAIRYLRHGIASFVESEIKSEYNAWRKTISRRFQKEYSCSNCRTETLVNLHKSGSSSGTKICAECDCFYNYIIKAHQYSKPFWNNCLFNKLSENYWQYAKCFMSGYGKETLTCSDDTDAAGLISICLHNRNLNQKFSNSEVLKKAIKSRHNIMHSGKQELTDDEANGYIDDFISVLKEISQEQKAQEATYMLEKLKNEKVVVTTKESICAHGDAMNAVLSEIQELLIEAKHIEMIRTKVGEFSSSDSSESDTMLEETNALGNIEKRLDDLHILEQKHSSALEKHSVQCSEIKEMLDGCFNDIKTINDKVTIIHQTTTETQTEVRLMHGDIQDVKQELEKLTQCIPSRGVWVPISATRLHVISHNIGKKKEDQFHLIVIGDNFTGDERWVMVIEAFKKFLASMSTGTGNDFREVTETKVECLAIYVQCWSPKAIIKLCEDCVSGRLTQLLKPVERALQKIPGYEFVELETVIYKKDVIECLNLLVRRLRRYCEETTSLETRVTFGNGVSSVAISGLSFLSNTAETLGNTGPEKRDKTADNINMVNNEERMNEDDERDVISILESGPATDNICKEADTVDQTCYTQVTSVIQDICIETSDEIRTRDKNHLNHKDCTSDHMMLDEEEVMSTICNEGIFDHGIKNVESDLIKAQANKEIEWKETNKLEYTSACDFDESSAKQRYRWQHGEVKVIQTYSRCDEDKLDETLMAKYYCTNFEEQQSEYILKEHWNRNLTSYREFMHALLYSEELVRIDIISSMNIVCEITPTDQLTSVRNGLVMYAQDGILFAKIELPSELSADSPLGRLTQNIDTLWLAPIVKGIDKPEKVYELGIENFHRDTIDVQLSTSCVADLNIDLSKPFEAEVQLQLDRLWLCEMHNAVDKLESLAFINPTCFPAMRLGDANFFRTNSLDDEDVKKCNEIQLDAIMKISLQNGDHSPPLLIVGPFGTGKTYTLALAAKCVLKTANTRVLICTHSNSEADIYITEYFDKFVANGNTEAKPLRIYYEKRRPDTVSATVKRYCLMKHNLFRQPILEDIETHRIIITTVRSAKLLSFFNKPPGLFTHIFLDEAAQVLEAELLIPLTLADRNTKVVLAGDHMQMSPEIYSSLAHEKQFHVSLIERLYNVYPVDSPYRVTLCENYRTNSCITGFMSELFYDSQLKTSADIPAHPDMYPLSFQVAIGTESKVDLEDGYYNLAEVDVIVKTIQKLFHTWPNDIWGEREQEEICVVAPYKKQIFFLRSELKKAGFGQVNVERVNNVQGKQFRVLIISVVRTCHVSDESRQIDIGFLSNVKILTTVITRAKSLVIAVGNPVIMCTTGECSDIWKRYIDVCHQHSSLNGMNWEEFARQCDISESKLNPMADEFIPSIEENEDYDESKSAVLPGNVHNRHSCSISATFSSPGDKTEKQDIVTVNNERSYAVPEYFPYETSDGECANSWLPTVGEITDLARHFMYVPLAYQNNPNANTAENTPMIPSRPISLRHVFTRSTYSDRSKTQICKQQQSLQRKE